MNSEFKFIGNIGKDPTPTISGDGVKFTLCVNESYKKDHEWIKTAHWFLISAFGFTKQAVVLQNIKKGDRVLVMGQIKTYKTNGALYSTTSFVAKQVFKIMSEREFEQENDWDKIKQSEVDESAMPAPVLDESEEIPF